MSHSFNFQLSGVIIVRTVERFDDLQNKMLEELGVKSSVVIDIVKGQITSSCSSLGITKGVYELDDFKLKFPKERYSVLMDNYFSTSELNALSKFSEYQIYLINYGVYLSKDEVSMSFPRFRQYPKFGLVYSYLKVKLRRIYQGVVYFGTLADIRSLVYSTRTVLFWNETSRSNFSRDYPFASTKNLGLYEKALDCLSSKATCEHVLLAPSALGHNYSILQNELTYWTDIAHLLHSLGIKSVVLSIHPMYKHNQKIFIEKGVFDRVICGVDSSELTNFDLVLTDRSTLFWMAPLSGVRSIKLKGYMIPNVYYGNINENH